jgi:MFS family permease
MTSVVEQAEPASWAQVRAARHFPQFVLLGIGIWLHAADSLLTATVMPAVVAEIGGVAYIAWATALYVLASIVAGAGAGVFALRLGLKQSILIGVAVYGAGCAMSALAPDMAVMLIGRTLQGAGGGALVALAHVAMSRLFPAELWPRLLACLAAIWGASALVGPLIGGLFAQADLWRGAFWAFAGQAGLLAVAFALYLPKADGGGTDSHAGTKVPWGRLALVSLGVLGIAAAGVVEDAAQALPLGLGGLAVIALAIRLDTRAAQPILPRAAFARGPVAAGLLMVLTLSIATMPFTVYAPLIMELLHGVGPLAVGYIMATESIAWTVAALLIAGAGPRHEPWLIVGGALVIATGVAGLAFTVPAGPMALIVTFAVMQGLGFGLSWAFIARRVVQAVSDAERPLASAVIPTTQLMGYAVGAAAAGIIANSLGMGDAPTAAVAQVTGFWLFILMLPIAAIGVAAAWRLSKSLA